MKKWYEEIRECYRCCAVLGDNVEELYEWEGELYCEQCLIDKLVDCGIINKIEEEFEND